MGRTFIFSEHKADYEKLWSTCKIDPAHLPEVKQLAERILAGKPRYEALAKRLRSEIPGMQWWILGVIHHMEAGCNFAKYQHNGELLGKVTTLKPAGKLFHHWEDSAIDASRMLLKGLDGTMPKLLSLLEGFNGYGYRLWRTVKSPYLWSYSNHYTKGKYIEVKDPITRKAKSVWKPDLISKQCGTAVILKYLESIGEIKL
jgi:lysozyme family protein